MLIQGEVHNHTTGDQLSESESSPRDTRSSTMNANIQEPPFEAGSAPKSHTGFPEPLSPDRNTTLPHPDADTSENATIEGPDIALTRTHSRRLFPSRHNGQKGYKGQASVSDVGLYDNIKYADGSKENKSRKAIEKDAEHRDGITDPPALDGRQSREWNERDGQEHREGQRKKGVLRKLALHKA